MTSMFGRPAFLVGVGTIHVMLTSLCGAHEGLAQGSTGGKIGKTDQELSGEISKGTPEKPEQSPRKRDPGASKGDPAGAALTAASLRGRWKGSLNCPDGRWDLQMDIREDSVSSFGGDYGNEGGKIVSGTLSGSRVSFVTQASISRSWSGSISRAGGILRIQGIHRADWGTNSPGAGNCKFFLAKG